MTMPILGSQRLLQIAVNQRPELLQSALRRSGALGRREAIEWISPLDRDRCVEYRDGEALRRLRLADPMHSPLRDFWPARGPVWDALAIAGATRPVLIEAKAHIPEAASPPTKASPTSKAHIEASLSAARRYYAPRSGAVWTGLFFQYANRLAHQFFLRERNGIESSLVFLYFTNATDMDGPASEVEWKGAVRLIHAVLGLPADLSSCGVHDAFLDARLLTDAA